MKNFLLLLTGLFLFSPKLLIGDEHKLRYQQEQFDAHWTLDIHHHEQGLPILLHIPLQAYIDPNSFLNDQLREFQDPDLHFARSAELAQFEIVSLRINGQNFPVKLETEFLELHLPDSIRGPLKLEMAYTFRLPDAKFTGNGRTKEGFRMINLLPALIPHGERPHPLSYYYDIHQNLRHFHVELEIDSSLKAISNLPESTSKDGRLVFSGDSRQFQLFVAPSWQVYSINNSRLILPEADESFKINFELALKELKAFFEKELNLDLGEGRDYLFLDDKKGEYQSAELISLTRPKKWEELRIELAQAQAEAFFRYQLAMDGWNNPWMARGIPYFYKYLFVEQVYPQKQWVPFESPILNGLFGFDAFDYGYQNRFLFLFLQRQGLDQAMQSPVDSLSRLNYEAIAQAKTYLLLSHLRAYTGQKDFRRGMYRFYHDYGDQASPENMEMAFAYYSPQSIDWFFDEAIQTAEIYDYQLKGIDHCPTVSTASVANRGQFSLPYSLTGFKDGEPVLTEWFEGHDTERTVQMYHAEYDKVVLNAHLRHSEYRQKNNTVYNRWLFPRAEPLQFQLYNSFEAAEGSQIFYVPSLYYNAYDQFLLGLNLSNRSILVQKPFEWLLVPEFSTGTGKLTGTGSVNYNWTLPKSAFFRQIKFGIYGRYNHYDRDLAFYRISPSINFFIRKPYPRSPYIQTMRLRGVILNREQSPQTVAEQTSSVSNASYTVLNANYRMEYTSILRPTILRTHIELGQNFGKVFVDCDQRWMLPNKKWLILRGFAGAFLYNDLADAGNKDNFYSFGLSGTPDYLFDYYLIGRSDETGIWSRQFFTTDGGFKTETQAFADRFLLSSNLSVPFIGPLGAFADVALSEEQVYWDYGIRLAFLTDFLELYLPLQNQDRRFYKEANYISNVRFVLDLQLGSIINRLRRGYY